MTNVKLKKQKFDGPLLLRRGGTVFELTHHSTSDVPAHIAVVMLGDEGLIIEFVKKDREAIVEFGNHELQLLNREFNITGSAEDAAEHLFPTKKKVAKKVAPKITKLEDLVAAAKKETSVKIQVKEEVAEDDTTQD